jgi:hypothetical protein
VKGEQASHDLKQLSKLVDKLATEYYGEKEEENFHRREVDTGFSFMGFYIANLQQKLNINFESSAEAFEFFDIN